MENTAFQIEGFSPGSKKSNASDKSEISPSQNINVERKKKKKVVPIPVCLVNCKYDIVHECFEKLHAVEVEEDADWIIMWSDLSVSEERVMQMKKYQRINHFPAMKEIARKAPLASNLDRMSKLFPQDFHFHPSTFILPKQIDELCSKMQEKKKTFILKPSTGCQGKGIILARSPADLAEMEENVLYVAQQYISKPFLVEGYKFDLRLYVLVTSCDPLTVFIFKEGMARFCTEKYSAPSVNNLDNSFMHLTNYSINKKSDTFVQNNAPTVHEGDESASKRTLTSVRTWMINHNYNYDLMWRRIEDVIVKTILSIQPRLAHDYHSFLTDYDGHSCFELLGFDILIDRKLKPWLIEVNHSPSFRCDSTVDTLIKQELLMNTLDLIHMSPIPKKKCMREDREHAHSRLFGGKKRFVSSKDEEEQMCSKRFDAQIKRQSKHLGKFEKIYPSPNREDYDKFIVDNIVKPGETRLTASRREVNLKKKMEDDGKSIIDEIVEPKPQISAVRHSTPVRPRPLSAVPMHTYKLPVIRDDGSPVEGAYTPVFADNMSPTLMARPKTQATSHANYAQDPWERKGEAGKKRDVEPVKNKPVSTSVSNNESRSVSFEKTGKSRIKSEPWLPRVAKLGRKTQISVKATQAM